MNFAVGIDLRRNSRRYLLASAVALVLGLVAIALLWLQVQSPLRLGIDFTGGTNILLALQCDATGQCGQQDIDIAAVRKVMSDRGYASSTIQRVTGDRLQGISIRTTALTVEERTNLTQELTKALAPFGAVDSKKTSINQIGPSVGAQTFQMGIVALVLSLAGIAVYLGFRFQLDYATFAIIALIHDVLITVGSFSVLGLVAGVEVDSLFLVAILTICGFSVNDTVVIYDRIRENMQKNEAGHDFPTVVNLAVNQSLARSINTSLTTVLPLLGILLFGGVTLKLFALALVIGFTAGAYSSIFVAPGLLMWWHARHVRG
ncbi:MAG: protein translocase subunit SecF [Oscillatoriales cyanobacterium SM2_2_1]|nr:protein translocase subunit SecF [Oscillatoriales cyanobacterium SM2_2_1]